jgi:hypothetical protein
MDVLNTDQVAGHYWNMLQHCEGFRSLLTALELVEKKFIILNLNSGTSVNFLLSSLFDYFYPFCTRFSLLNTVTVL